MASEDAVPIKWADEVIDLTGDSDDDACVLLAPVLVHPAIKIEPQDDKTNIGSPSMLGISSSFDPIATEKVTDPKPQQVATEAADVDSSVERPREEIKAISKFNAASPDLSTLEPPAYNSVQDQEIPELPELSPLELPDDSDKDPLDDLSSAEALLQYLQNESQFEQSNNNSSDAAFSSIPATSTVRAAANFARLEKIYDQKKANNTTTGEDEIRFIAAKAAELKRLRDLERSQRLIPTPIESESLPTGYQYEEDSLFIPEAPDRPEPAKKRLRKAARPQNKVNAKETREAMAIGLKGPPARKRSAPTTGDQSQPRKRKDTKKTPRVTKPKTRTPSRLTNLASLGRSNIVEDAQANADKPGCPTFTSKNKKKALQELLASIPSAETGTCRSDGAAVHEATKKFNGKGAMRSDGEGGWKLKGMRSSLYNHQLLGAAFLRDRENGSQRPFGGLLCDEMGFGKTIQMIANIVDGKAPDGAVEKTTLIVAPGSLLNQWMMELDKHVSPGALARIIRYHSGARLLSNDPVADLRAYDIILTTYSEVQKSYPACEPPKHLASENSKNLWWANFYKENVGPLHRIKYLRIVLDEAHQIKSHTSKTSMAVRALTGTFRWAITGTPILNYIEELFPYFSFLKVPHTGDFSTFTHNYCNDRKHREPVNMGRIHNILRAIMLRRTHRDTMFSLPIVKLPGISHSTRSVEFNRVERAIYDTIKQRFVENINRVYRAGQLSSGYSNILAMIHYLRMLCSHVLLSQRLLKRIFDAADVEVLSRLIENEPSSGNDEVGLISVLRKIIHSKSNTGKAQSSVSRQPSMGSDFIISSRDMSASARPRGDDDDEEEEEEQEHDWIEMGKVPLSAKLVATRAAIHEWRERSPSEKIIIYTQYLDMVRLLGKVCNAEGWNYVQFTGKMSLTSREKVLNQFTKDKTICIMICSLKAGGIGLNLTMASKVVILDLWFNSSLEAQAYCRAFRIGQERKVEVLRFVVKDSIDEDLIEMQERKDIEVQGAIGPESHNDRATISQLLSLFGEVTEEDGQNEFILVEDESQVDHDADVDIEDRLPPRPF